MNYIYVLLYLKNEKDANIIIEKNWNPVLYVFIR